MEVWDAGGEKFVELDGSPGNYGIKQGIANAKAGGYILTWRQSGRKSSKAGTDPYSVRVYYMNGTTEVLISQSPEFAGFSKMQWAGSAFGFKITPEQLAAAGTNPVYVAFIPTGASLNTYGTLIDKVSLLPVEFKTYPDTEPGPNKAHKRNLKHLPAYDVHYSSDWKKCVCKVWDTSGKINLIDYLEGGAENRALYENTVKWKVNGTVQESHELSFGGEPADDEQQHFFVEVLPKTGDSATIDRLIVNVVPRTTKTKFDNWYSANLADMGWLNHLPAIYSQLGAGNSDPEPFVWGINLWIAPTSLSGSFYHPESSFDLRSQVVDSFDETYAGCGHQATYDSTGGLIRADKGVSAGSADRVASIPAGGAYTGYTHLVADVTPFVWASQLDGNPCSATSPLPTNLTHPMLHEGVFLKKYLQVRPTIANGKPELLPRAQ